MPIECKFNASTPAVSMKRLFSYNIQLIAEMKQFLQSLKVLSAGAVVEMVRALYSCASVAPALPPRLQNLICMESRVGGEPDTCSCFSPT
jgi:hypothetical protein